MFGAIRKGKGMSQLYTYQMPIEQGLRSALGDHSLRVPPHGTHVSLWLFMQNVKGLATSSHNDDLVHAFELAQACPLHQGCKMNAGEEGNRKARKHAQR